MSRTIGHSLALIGFVGTGSAIVLPWAQYGGIDVDLFRFPLWGLYIAAAIALQAVVLWRLVRDDRRATIAGIVLGLATIAAAVVVIFDYDNASTFFGPIVPMVIPRPGVGGPLAVLAAICSTVAAVAPRRAPAPATTASAAV